MPTEARGDDRASLADRARNALSRVAQPLVDLSPIVPLLGIASALFQVACPTGGRAIFRTVVASIFPWLDVIELKLVWPRCFFGSRFLAIDTRRSFWILFAITPRECLA